MKMHSYFVLHSEAMFSTKTPDMAVRSSSSSTELSFYWSVTRKRLTCVPIPDYSSAEEMTGEKGTAYLVSVMATRSANATRETDENVFLVLDSRYRLHIFKPKQGRLVHIAEQTLDFEAISPDTKSIGPRSGKSLSNNKTALLSSSFCCASPECIISAGITRDPAARVRKGQQESLMV